MAVELVVAIVDVLAIETQTPSKHVPEMPLIMQAIPFSVSCPLAQTPEVQSPGKKHCPAKHDELSEACKQSATAVVAVAVVDAADDVDFDAVVDAG